MKKLLFLLVNIVTVVLSFSGCKQEVSNGESNSIYLWNIDKYGYIDKSGKFVINPQFDDAGNFDDGLAWVKIGGKYGLIDKSGKFVINPQFDDAGNFDDGLAWVKIGNKYGFIDKSGKFVINPQFDDARFFNDGLAWVGIGSPSRRKYGLIDKSGKFVINPQFADAGNFDDGLACVRMKIGDKYGFIDKSGKFVINPQFDYAGNFDDGIARVGIGVKYYLGDENEGSIAIHTYRYGYIDKSGKFVINTLFDDASDFNDGLARVRIHSFNRK